MKRFLNRIASLTFVFAAMGAVALAHADAKPFVHPGMLQSRSDLELMKRKVLAGEQPWKGAWDRLLGQTYSSLDFHPQPAAHVIRGPFGRPSIGGNELMASADAAGSHALQWYVTGDKRHAEKVIEIIDAWGPVLQDLQQNDAKLLVGWTGHQFLNAAEIVRYSDGGWTEKETEQLRRMMLGVYYPLIKDFFPDANGNWDAAIMDTMLCMGIFFDDHSLFDRAVDHYVRGRLNGGITHYVYPSGQCQETTRDQAHAQLGLGEMAQACQVAWTQGVDLFGAADNRLALGFEYTARFMLGKDVPCEDTPSMKARDQFRDIYHGVYDHYHFVAGLEMPYTAEAAERSLPRSLSVLTMYQGARPGAGPVQGHAPLASAIAADSGAEPAPRPQQPAEAVTLHPEQSIQAALDRAAGGPKWIILEAGIYKLPATLRVPSGVTLAGRGRSTVLWLDPHVSGAAIVNQDLSAHDIAIRDLIIEGAVTTERHADPNSDRRTRSRPGAPDRGGIAFASDAGQSMHDIHLTHLTVRNCTLSGIRISGADQVEIDACSLTDNGNRANTTHDLDLKNVSHGRVLDSRLNNSPVGCGAAVVDCHGLLFETSEIARNVLQGVHLDHSSDVRFHGNLIEANESGGIGAGDGCASISIDTNTVQNNSIAAIDVRGATASTLGENVLRENRLDIAR